MLRIPTSADNPPPLLAAVRQEIPEGSTGEKRPKKANKRRRNKKGGGDHAWEQAPRSNRSRRGEQRSMRLMLIGGGLLFTAIVAGVIVSMVTGKSPHTAVKTPDPPTASPLIQRSEASILAEAEPLARKFLEGKTVDDLLPTVRNPGVTETRMREFYPGGKVVPPGLSKFNTGSGLVTKGKLYSFPLLTRDLEERAIGFIDTPQGLRIDWESWVGWSSMPWEKFLAEMPAASQIFRVTLSPVDYYNFGFSDETKWRSYRLESPDKEHAVYGYVAKNTVLDQQLRPNEDEKHVLVTLALKFPKDSKSSGQVEIEKLVCEGWVEQGDTP